MNSITSTYKKAYNNIKKQIKMAGKNLMRQGNNKTTGNKGRGQHVCYNKRPQRKFR